MKTLVLALILCSTAHADIYSYVDEDGDVTYTNMYEPPESKPSKKELQKLEEIQELQQQILMNQAVQQQLDYNNQRYYRSY